MPPPPRPFSLSSTTSFDDPPASTTTRATFEALSRIRRNLTRERELLNASREATRALRRRAIRDLQSSTSRLSSVQSNLDMLTRRRRRPSNDSFQSADASNTDSSNPPSRTLPVPRPSTSQRYPRAHRSMTLLEPNDMTSSTTPGPPPWATRDSSSRHSHHSHGLPRPRSHVESLHRRAIFTRHRDREANTAIQGSGPESESDITMFRPRAKRRKFTHDPETSTYDPVIYGWNGQVESGLLRLEIASCDGGEYKQNTYSAENVLRDDKTVYCSHKSKCNLLFRHQAESIFHLESLVIQAPETGFTAPVQQGLVFVGMSAEDLIRASANYSLGYDNHPRGGNFSLSFENGNGSSLNLTSNEAASRTFRWGSQFDNVSTYSSSSDDEGRLSPLENPPASSTNPALSVPTPPANNLHDTDSSASDDGESGAPYRESRNLQAEIQDLIRLIRDTSPSATSDLMRMNSQFEELMDSMYPGRPHGPPQRRASPRRVEVRDTNDSGYVEADAAFFIPKSQSKITVKFDPPL
jgi:hypothetical protein